MIGSEFGGVAHVVVINRWAERYADFARYIDHRAHRVTYVSTEVGLASIPCEAADVITVKATDDLAEVTAAVDDLALRHCAPAGIVALKEDDLLVGAALRERWSTAGPRTEELLPFRDKYVMATRVAGAGIPVPLFTLAPGTAAVRGFAGSAGWPVIVKPRIGSASEGVVRVEGPADLGRLSFPDGPRLVQEFNPHQIYHVDGVFGGERLLAVRCSRYLNNCLEFRCGTVLGSVEESDPGISRIIADFTGQVMRALSDRPVVFHLELFFDLATGSCAFLEVGARVGGAEIPLLWREVHGHDLMETAFRIQLGLPVREQVSLRADEIGGWLLVPAPESRPCKITEITSMVGRSPGPYAEALLAAGDILPAADSYYEHVGGRFRFRGRSSSAVEEAVRATAAGFRVSAELAVP